MNTHALAMAFLATLMVFPVLYIYATDELCVECDHSKWLHGDNTCAGSDHVLGGHIEARRACRCNGHKSPNKKRGSGNAQR